MIRKWIIGGWNPKTGLIKDEVEASTIEVARKRARRKYPKAPELSLLEVSKDSSPKRSNPFIEKAKQQERK